MLVSVTHAYYLHNCTQCFVRRKVGGVTVPVMLNVPCVCYIYKSVIIYTHISPSGGERVVSRYCCESVSCIKHMTTYSPSGGKRVVSRYQHDHCTVYSIVYYVCVSVV